MSQFKRILLPYDGSDVSTRALETAVQLARGGDGRILVLHVLDELEYLSGYEYGGAPLLESLRSEARRVLDRAGELCAAAGVAFEKRVVEHPGGRLADAVANEATAWEADLVVVGTHGRRGVSRALLGSGAEQIIRFAPVPVLVVRNAPQGRQPPARGQP